MDIADLQIPPSGICIYCGSDGGDGGLRDEHIIPYSLGGNAILPKASCRECEKITSYLDGYLARSLFYDFRLQRDMQSRRRSNRPTHRPATISVDGARRTVQFDLSSHPNFLNMPVWGRPGLMYAEQPTLDFNECSVLTFVNSGPATRQAIDASPDQRVALINEININLRTFARAIARIAYCSITAQLGVGNFRPLITPALILGSYPYVSHFVGCSPDYMAPRSDSEHGHMIEYGLYEHGRLRLIFAQVRLFSNCGTVDVGMPRYEVLVGAPKSDSLPILEGHAH